VIDVGVVLGRLFSGRSLLVAACHHLSRDKHGAILLLLSMRASLLITVFFVVSQIITSGFLVELFILLSDRYFSNLALSLIRSKLLGVFGFHEVCQVVLTELRLNFLRWRFLLKVQLILLWALLDLVVGSRICGGRAFQHKRVAYFLEFALLVLKQKLVIVEKQGIHLK